MTFATRENISHKCQKEANRRGDEATIMPLIQWHWPRTWLHTLILRLAHLWKWTSFKLPFLLTPAFHHDRLKNSDSFRLIRLPEKLNDKAPDQFSLTLETFPLDECPEYLALSYTWGPSLRNAAPYDTYDSRPILVNGKHLLIYPSLRDALKHTITARPGSYIWADGICINQDDLEERAEQVSIMDLIYTRATETIVWIGPETERAKRGLDKIREMAKGAPRQIMEWGTSQTSGSAFVVDDQEHLTRSGLPSMTNEQWLDVSEIYSREWFERVWVIQEVALSRNPTVLVGDLSIPWADVGNAAVLIMGSNASLGVLGIGQNQEYFTLVLGVSLAAMVQILHEWCRGDQSQFRDIFHSLDFSIGLGDTPQKDLLSLLMIIKAFKSSIRQDKIYGILGILNHLYKAKGMPPSTMEIDYKSPPDQVLLSLGCDLYNKTQSLHLLSHAGEASRKLPSTNPTWIPSFENANYPILSPSFTNAKPYDASNSLPPNFRIVHQPVPRLHVQVSAPHLGSIEALGDTSNDFMLGRFLNTITLLLHSSQTDDNGHAYYPPTSQPIVEVLWRLLILDSDLSSRPADSSGTLSSAFKS